MSKLKSIREQQHLTQDELAEQSGVSIRTIQRIEAGAEPKGQTLKLLASTLGVTENMLLSDPAKDHPMNFSLIKLINLSSLPMTVFPPLNILAPLIIMWIKKEMTPLTRQIVSLQIAWTLAAITIFMLTVFIKSWLELNKNIIPLVMLFLVLSNVLLILRNTAEIERREQLFFRLNFSII